MTVALLLLIPPRLHSGSALWLDEAQSVAIARLPVPRLLEALRHDGSPPFYYLLLHGWITLWGTGPTAVRSLSSVASVLSLAVAYLIGRWLSGPRTGRSCVLVLAACPFAIRYATEARMYAVALLLGLIGVWVVLWALRRPSRGALVAVAAVSGLLALTHYWALFLLAVTEVVLLALAARARWRGPPVLVCAAVAGGLTLITPWVPSLVFQLQHTGTPWAPGPTWRDVPATLGGWVGPGWAGTALGVVVVLLLVRAATDPRGRALLVVGFGALAVGLLSTSWQGSGYALRYTSALIAPLLVAVGLGAARFRDRGLAVLMAAVTALSVTVLATSPLLERRTQAADTAAVLRADLAPGDVVIFCPDQLGPAVTRLLPTSVTTMAYPTGQPADHVDWVDYAARNAAVSPAAFAAAAIAHASGAIWLVRADGYRTFGAQCADLDADLGATRGCRTVDQLPAGPGEVEAVIRFASCPV